MLGSFPGSVPSELYPPPPNTRADTLAIKQRMAELLTPEHGQQYWTSFVSFIKGKIDRHDFEADTTRLLNSQQLVGLHNTLVLSIVYNTTCPESPPINPPNHFNLYTTGEGWHKRKRPPPATNPLKSKPKPEDLDPKKRKLKEAVLALGQRERNRIKQIPALKEKEKEFLQKQTQNSIPLKNPQTNYLSREKIDNVTNTPLASKMKISSSTLYQDYMRCQQAPLCSESKQLPDCDTLKDRMMLIAYDSGLVNGVDQAATSLALIALEVHLKTLLGDLLSLIRSDRPVLTTAAVDSPSSRLPIPSTSFNGAHVEERAGTPRIPSAPHLSTSSRPLDSSQTEADNNRPPESAAPTLAYQTTSSLRLRDPKTQGLAPHLTAKDFAALSEISPHSFVRCHPGALERLISTHSFSEPCSSDDDEDDDEPHTRSTDLPGVSAQPNGQPWINGAQSSTTTLHLRGTGLNGALHANQSSSSRLTKTPSFSPRSTNKISGRTNAIDISLLGSRTIARNKAFPDTFDNTFFGERSVANGKIATWPEPKPNGTHLVTLRSKPPPVGPSTNTSNSMANGVKLPQSPDFHQSPQRRKDSALATPQKSLAAELFPEDTEALPVAVPPPPRAGSGSESEPDEGRVQRSIKFNGQMSTTTGNPTTKRKGWERIDTFRLLENIGN